MKKIIFVAGAVWLAAGGPIMADQFTYPEVDIMAALIDAGATCSAEGKKIIVCKCGTGQTPLPYSGEIEVDCGLKDHNSNIVKGCRFLGETSDNDKAYCMETGAGNACEWCGCKNIANDSDWKSVGSNRVSRGVQTVNSSGYTCDVTSTTEYGCAAGYYKSAGTGATMTCTRCPASGGVDGTNAIGTTDITTCTLPGTTKMTDLTGTYECTSNYVYKN